MGVIAIFCCKEFDIIEFPGYRSGTGWNPKKFVQNANQSVYSLLILFFYLSKFIFFYKYEILK